MPANTYTLIEKIVVGAAGASSITFTSIPQTYTDLKVVISVRDATNNNGVVKITFNGSASGYTARQLYGTGSVAASNTDYTGSGTYYGTEGSSAPSNATASTFSNCEFYIPNYTSSNNKSISADSLYENNASLAYQSLSAGLWSNSAAITSITVTQFSGNNFAQYSTAYLYGIAKEGVSPSPSSAPYATGGDSIVFDGTYWIHTFTSSGTFTPKTSLTCDYLVVAGGGGGGRANNGGYSAGGGGGGGLRCTVSATGGGGSLESKLALSANTNYTVTIGAGGSGGGADNTGGFAGSNSVFSTITSTGGGAGGGQSIAPISGGTGGSGGGGGGTNPGTGGGAGTANQGYAGGGGSNGYNGGGGGGAGAAGANGANSGVVGGAGGNGVATSISGSSVTYAGGGGGAGYNTVSTAGTGGGGAGSASMSIAGVAGTANTGGGGGGSSPSATNNGGSGIVIVRYAA